MLGFDAMDVELVRRWAAAGYLPTFRRLFESAAWADYIDPPEHSSGTQWPSIHTGYGPLRHDLYYSLRFCGGSYRTRIGRADDVKRVPFWKWFAQAGLRIVLADAPFTIPRLEYGGKQFWGWGVHDWLWKKSSVPEGLLSALSAKYGAHPIPYCHDHSTETDSLLRFRSGLLIAIERRTAILKSLIVCGDWDLFYGVYSEPHCAGHLMWHLEDESHSRHSPDQLATVGHALRDIYIAIDRAVAELLGSIGPETTCTIFFSHGMGPNYHGCHLFPGILDRFNRRWRGESIGARQQESQNGLLDSLWEGSVGRMPAAWRVAMKHRLPMSIRSWISTKRRQNPRRWSREPAFSLSQDGFSSLRVNLACREPQGRIRPGEEYRQYLDVFTAELLQLTNAETGEPVVERVFRADQQVDPVTMDSGTDLIVWWRKSGPIRAIRSATLGTVSGEFSEIRTGEHVMRGMFLVSHPQARRGYHAIPDMQVVDIPPTLCELAGIQPGTTFEGTSRCRDFLIA